MVTKGKGDGEDKSGVWDYQKQTTIHRIHKQQVPTV